MKKNKAVIFFLLLTAGALGAQDQLVLISPHWEGIKTEFERAFQEHYHARTGRRVQFDWRDMGGASDDLRFVLSEFRQSPASIGIDLFFGGGLDPYLELQKQGLLEKWQPPERIRQGIPSDLNGLPLYAADGSWYGAALSTFGILRNDEVIRRMGLPSARTWRDLADPRLAGWVSSGDPRNSGATHMVYESILQAYGWDEGWRVIAGLSANVRQFDRSGSAAAKACALGNAAYALVVDFYGLTQIAEVGPDRMSLVIPTGESILNPDCIGILKGAPHRGVAEAFMEFVLSEEGQSLWLAPRGDPAGPKTFSIERMAVRPALYKKFAAVSLVKTNPFRDLAPMRYNAALGTLRWGALNALLGAVYIDRPVSQRRDARPPVTEAQFDAICRHEWSDPILRNRRTLSWQSPGKE